MGVAALLSCAKSASETSPLSLRSFSKFGVTSEAGAESRVLASVDVMTPLVTNSQRSPERSVASPSALMVELVNESLPAAGVCPLAGAASPAQTGLQSATVNKMGRIFFKKRGMYPPER